MADPDPEAVMDLTQLGKSVPRQLHKQLHSLSRTKSFSANPLSKGQPRPSGVTMRQSEQDTAE